MLYVMKLLEVMGLTVQKPMIVECDNKGAVDLANNWSTNGRTKHMQTRQFFIRELKEEGIIKVNWVCGSKNESDLFTKNLDGPTSRDMQ